MLKAIERGYYSKSAYVKAYKTLAIPISVAAALFLLAAVVALVLARRAAKPATERAVSSQGG